MEINYYNPVTCKTRGGNDRLKDTTTNQAQTQQLRQEHLLSEVAARRRWRRSALDKAGRTAAVLDTVEESDGNIVEAAVSEDTVEGTAGDIVEVEAAGAPSSTAVLLAVLIAQQLESPRPSGASLSSAVRQALRRPRQPAVLPCRTRAAPRSLPSGPKRGTCVADFDTVEAVEEQQSKVESLTVQELESSESSEGMSASVFPGP